jgi:hypothetical protein
MQFFQREVKNQAVLALEVRKNRIPLNIKYIFLIIVLIKNNKKAKDLSKPSSMYKIVSGGKAMTIEEYLKTRNYRGYLMKGEGENEDEKESPRFILND